MERYRVDTDMSGIGMSVNRALRERGLPQRLFLFSNGDDIVDCGIMTVEDANKVALGEEIPAVYDSITGLTCLVVDRSVATAIRDVARLNTRMIDVYGPAGEGKVGLQILVNGHPQL